MKTVKKTLKILETILEQQGYEIGVSDLARITRLNISTVHGIISDLVEWGYLKQEGKRGKYSLGLKFLEFADIIKKKMAVRRVALPFLDKLMRLVNESVNMGILGENEVIIIETIKSPQALTVVTRDRVRLPLYSTGVGKAILAYIQDEDLERFLNGITLMPLTPNTITDYNELKKHLKIIKEEGFAFDDEETEPGIRNIASPVRDWSGIVVAAIGVIGPTVRITDERIREIAKAVISCASDISSEMGYRGE